MVDIPLLIRDLVLFLSVARVVNLLVFLPALLFEGAWHAKLSLLRENWRAIFFLAGPGLLLSLVIIAAALHILDQLDWATALLLAAILSPTDPVAVLGLFRQLHVSWRRSTVRGARRVSHQPRLEAHRRSGRGNHHYPGISLWYLLGR